MPRSRLRYAIIGSFWSTAWLVLPMLAYWPIGSPAYEAAVNVVRIFPLAAERGLGLSATGFWSVALIAVFLALFSISCLLLWLIRLLDPHAMTLKSLLWTLRTAPCAIAWLTGLVACAATALLVEGWLQSVAWFFFVTVFFLMPFLCLRSDIVASDRPPWIWKPHWPGMLAAALLLASAMASAIFSVSVVMTDAIEPPLMRIPVVVLIELGGWFVGLMMTALAIGAWLSHLRWQDVSQAWKDFVRYRCLAPLAAADLRIALVIIAALLVPTLSTAFHMIYVAPEVESHLQASNQPVPGVLRGLWAMARWAGEWWWLVLGIPLAWFSLAWSARIVHSAAPGRSRGPASIDQDHKPAHE